MNLTIDIGNTRSKFAIFNNGEIIDVITKNELFIEVIGKILKKHPRLDNAIISSVRDINSSIIKFLESNFKFFIELTSETQVPVENLYETKNTLGKDRLAAVIGANNIFPNSNVLVIDMGTAITFDFINKNNQYLGGTISPGLEMRFKALNHFTGKLPLLEKNEKFNLVANNTENAIISGVQNGIIFEVDSYITRLKHEYEGLRTILTGGDAIFFDKMLKNTIFVNSNLNHIGLNKILEYNTTK